MNEAQYVKYLILFIFLMSFTPRLKPYLEEIRVVKELLQETWFKSMHPMPFLVGQTQPTIFDKSLFFWGRSAIKE
jgi:hypothetical protein